MPRKPSYRNGILMLGLAAAALAAADGAGQDRGNPSDSRHSALEHHPGDRVRQDEHMAMLDLAPVEEATHVAAADGNWDDKATWNGGSIPGEGSRVAIGVGRTVTIRTGLAGQKLEWVRVDGTLRFDPAADTSLRAVTIVGTPDSLIEIGSENGRIRPDKSACIIIADRGPRDAGQRQRDPYDLSGGFLAHGAVRIFGAEYTSHAVPRAVPRKGDTVVRFAMANKGWKVGDTLLFAGLDRESRFHDTSIDPWTGKELPKGQHEDEQRTIESLSDGGATITLDQPLKFQHGDIFGFPGPVPVGNLTRNVIVESENAGDISRRGHVMFMHTQDVVVDSALFSNLGRTSVEGTLTSPEVKDGRTVDGTDANTVGRYVLHFHLRWGATYRQQPFIVRNSALVDGPKLGLVNHGGYGLVDDNVSYNIRGSHYFTENGSEIGRFRGNLAVRSSGNEGDDDGLPIPSEKGYAGHPLNIGHGGHGFWLQGGGVDVTDDVAIGHTYGAFSFFVANNRTISFGGPQERNNPRTRGTAWEKLDVFLAENLADRSLAHGNAFIHTSAVPFHAARCIGLASADGLRVRGIDRTEFLCLHDRRDLIEDCQFVWNGRGFDLGYSPGLADLRNVSFIGGNPDKPIGDFGIGAGNHIPGFIRLENVSIDGYTVGYSVPPRGENIIQGGFINGVRKIELNYPWGGKLLVNGVSFGTMKGEEKEKILWGTSYGDNGVNLLYAPPYSNWTRKFQPFEFVYNGRTVYYDDQLPGAIPFDITAARWVHDNYGPKYHGPLNGKTSQQLWDEYHLAIGGRLAPADVTPCPDVRGGWYGSEVAFQPVMESEPNSAYYGGEQYRKLFGDAPPDGVSLNPRYMYDPIHIDTPRKAYVATVTIAGIQYHSAPTDLTEGVNLIPISTPAGNRYLPVGSPVRKKGKSY